ncbi:MAG TPA: MFS transporter, partial [Candidatus Lokiarchaeia archaeon]|nr:MFS transporter [Candidatus Lokiarchaeia archaeon]
LGDLFHIEQRGRLIAAYTTILYIIRGFALVGNGFIGYAIDSWTIPIGIFAILGVAAIIIFWRLAPEPRFGGAEPELAQVKYSYHFHPKELKPILSKKTNILFILQGLSGSAGVAIVTKYLQYWLTADTSLAPDAVHVDPYLATIILGAGGAVGALCGIQLAGFLADRAYKQGKIAQVLYLATACLFLEVVAYAIVLLVPIYPSGTNLTIEDVGAFITIFPVFLAFIIGFNFCTLFSTPIGTTVDIVRTHVNLPEHRGTVQAIYNFTNFLGAGIGIFAANLIFAAVASYRLTVVYGALFWLISGVIWIFALFTIKKDFASVRDVLNGRGIQLRDTREINEDVSN